MFPSNRLAAPPMVRVIVRIYGSACELGEGYDTTTDAILTCAQKLA